MNNRNDFLKFYDKDFILSLGKSTQHSNVQTSTYAASPNSIGQYHNYVGGILGGVGAAVSPVYDRNAMDDRINEVSQSLQPMWSHRVKEPHVPLFQRILNFINAVRHRGKKNDA